MLLPKRKATEVAILFITRMFVFPCLGAIGWAYIFGLPGYDLLFIPLFALPIATLFYEWWPPRIEFDQLSYQVLLQWATALMLMYAIDLTNRGALPIPHVDVRDLPWHYNLASILVLVSMISVVMRIRKFDRHSPGSYILLFLTIPVQLVYSHRYFSVGVLDFSGFMFLAFCVMGFLIFTITPKVEKQDL